MTRFPRGSRLSRVIARLTSPADVGARGADHDVGVHPADPQTDLADSSSREGGLARAASRA